MEKARRSFGAEDHGAWRLEWRMPIVSMVAMVTGIVPGKGGVRGLR